LINCIPLTCNDKIYRIPSFLPVSEALFSSKMLSSKNTIMKKYSNENFLCGSTKAIQKRKEIE